MSGQEYQPTVAVLDPTAADTALCDVAIGGIATAVATYYDHPVKELVARGSHDLETRDAINVMFTLIADHGLMDETELAPYAGCKPSVLGRRLDRIRGQAAEDPKFKAHLEELAEAAAGEPLR